MFRTGIEQMRFGIAPALLLLEGMWFLCCRFAAWRRHCIQDFNAVGHRMVVGVAPRKLLHLPITSMGQGFQARAQAMGAVVHGLMKSTVFCPVTVLTASRGSFMLLSVPILCR